MHMIKQDQSKVRNMDLLWRYYEKNRSFGKAAHVLASLADMHRSVTMHFFTQSVNAVFFFLLTECMFFFVYSSEISLQQRLEYISRAILSAKSSSCISSMGADGEFLHELEEKMEVYKIGSECGC